MLRCIYSLHPSKILLRSVPKRGIRCPMRITLMHKVIARLPNGKWKKIAVSTNYDALKKLHRQMESDMRIRRIESKVRLKSFVEVDYGKVD